MRRLLIIFSIFGIILLARYFEDFPGYYPIMLKHHYGVIYWQTFLIKIDIIVFLLFPLIPLRFYSNNLLWALNAVGFTLLAVIPLASLTEYVFISSNFDVEPAWSSNCFHEYLEHFFFFSIIAVFILFSCQLWTTAPSNRK